MAVAQIIGGAMMAYGAYKAYKEKTPSMDMGSMNSALDLINKQYGAIDSYFKEANQAYEGQYKTYYGQTMQDAVNAIAGNGLYESPVSQNVLNRQQVALGEQYATGKSQLAGQRLSALGAIDQQKIGYYQNLSALQYKQAQDESARRSQMISMISGAGASMMGGM